MKHIKEDIEFKRLAEEDDKDTENEKRRAHSRRKNVSSVSTVVLTQKKYLIIVGTSLILACLALILSLVLLFVTLNQHKQTVAQISESGQRHNELSNSLKQIKEEFQNGINTMKQTLKYQKIETKNGHIALSINLTMELEKRVDAMELLLNKSMKSTDRKISKFNMNITDLYHSLKDTQKEMNRSLTSNMKKITTLNSTSTTTTAKIKDIVDKMDKNQKLAEIKISFISAKLTAFQKTFHAQNTKVISNVNGLEEYMNLTIIDTEFSLLNLKNDLKELKEKLNITDNTIKENQFSANNTLAYANQRLAEIDGNVTALNGILVETRNSINKKMNISLGGVNGMDNIVTTIHKKLNLMGENLNKTIDQNNKLHTEDVAAVKEIVALQKQEFTDLSQVTRLQELRLENITSTLDLNQKNIALVTDNLSVNSDNISVIAGQVDDLENVTSWGKAKVEELQGDLDNLAGLLGETRDVLLKQHPYGAHRAVDCTEAYFKGLNTSGVFWLHPYGTAPFPVYCDMTDGGWTVFMRRYDGTVDFYRNWNDYKKGFGNLTQEHWLGNDKLHLLTNQKAYKLRVDFTDWSSRRSGYVVYTTFKVEDEKNKYRLQISGYTGKSGFDGLTYHNNNKFSTMDQDNDNEYDSCAQKRQGAHWYDSCSKSNPTGVFRGSLGRNFQCMYWRENSNPKCTSAMTLKIQPIE